MIDFGFGVELDTIDEHLSSKLREVRNDYTIWKWCRQPTLISEAQHKEWFKWHATDSKTKMFSIKEEGFDTYVGVCGLTSIDWLNRHAEFSLYIFPEHQKSGFGRQALKTLLSHAFRDMNMNLIWGETFENNPAYKMFIDLGFQHEGTRRDFYFKDGKYINAHLVSIKASEWTSPQRQF